MSKGASASAQGSLLRARLQPGLAQRRRRLCRGKIFQQPVGWLNVAGRREAARRKHRRALQMKRDGSDDCDTPDLLQLADLLYGEVRLARQKPFGGKALGNDGGAGIDLSCDAQLRDQLREENAAGAETRIGDRSRAQ